VRKLRNRNVRKKNRLEGGQSFQPKIEKYDYAAEATSHDNRVERLSRRHFEGFHDVRDKLVISRLVRSIQYCSSTFRDLYIVRTPI
jgi:hypothetical protein